MGRKRKQNNLSFFEEIETNLKWQDEKTVARRLGITYDQLTSRVGVVRSYKYKRTPAAAAIDLVIDARKTKCALVLSDTVPELTLPLTPELGARLIKEIPVDTSKFKFSCQRYPASLPPAFYKLIAVHALNAIEGITMSLDPAIAIAIRSGFFKTIFYEHHVNALAKNAH